MFTGKSIKYCYVFCSFNFCSSLFCMNDNNRNSLSGKENNEVKVKIVKNSPKIVVTGFKSAFNNCELLQKVDLSCLDINKNTEIDGNVFSGCKNLKEVIVSKNSEKYIKESLLYNNSSSGKNK